ncbi:hypothetical protein LCGC14_0894200 [marine sediment metagenome]|uniref:Uncharacterized protein n=1 Tax=marine sediment metagenome TaxID=412755 RepID=A0A0F9NYD7_9ZZZZ
MDVNEAKSKRVLYWSILYFFINAVGYFFIDVNAA